MAYTSVEVFLKSLDGGILLPHGEVAFTVSMLPMILELSNEKQWIILGGDVLTPDGVHTYDNWYYEPDHGLPLTENVTRSVEHTEQYISNYRKRNGDNNLYVFVISNGLASQDE